MLSFLCCEIFVNGKKVEKGQPRNKRQINKTDNLDDVRLIKKKMLFKEIRKSEYDKSCGHSD